MDDLCRTFFDVAEYVADLLSERIGARLGPEGFASEKARGANLPVDEALAFVAIRLGGGT